MGRHTAPPKRAAQKPHAARSKPERAPSGTPRPTLPALALAVTAAAGLGAATVGTAQASVQPGAPGASVSVFATGRAVEPEQRGAFGPSSRDLARGALEAAPKQGSQGMATAPSDADDEYAGRKVLSSGECEASFYNTGAITANGEPFDTTKLTAANKTLPFNTMVRVTNLANHKSVVVRINDRGPYIAGRCLDLTPPAMKQIAGGAGTAQVRYEVLGKK